MAMNKLKNVVVTGLTADVGAAEELSTSDLIFGTVSNMADIFSEEDDFISTKAAGIQTLLGTGIGFLAGEWMGHKRAADGKGAFIGLGA